jgi:uncharacterized membrane protein YfcA
MDVYLPIANLAVNGLVIVGLGALTGLLSGMFGVGGGFLTTPLLIFYGVPPTVAAASAASQVTGASVSGPLPMPGAGDRLSHGRRAGGGRRAGNGDRGLAVPPASGAGPDRYGHQHPLCRAAGRDRRADGAREHHGPAREPQRRGAAARRRRHHPLVASLPLRWRFYRSGLYISPLAPLLLGMATGILTMLMGIGGGFILVPAMLYILGMGVNVVVGTSLFQILFVTMATTMMHALTTHAVDIVLAGLLLIGSVSQIGAQFAQKAKPEQLRLILAIIVLGVALRMALGLGYRPDEIYSVVPL